jgi:hypothetical protein
MVKGRHHSDAVREKMIDAMKIFRPEDAFKISTDK